MCKGVSDLERCMDYFALPGKGHLISKANCQVEDSPKKRTKEFAFLVAI